MASLEEISHSINAGTAEGLKVSGSKRSNSPKKMSPAEMLAAEMPKRKKEETSSVPKMDKDVMKKMEKAIEEQDILDKRKKIYLYLSNARLKVFMPPEMKEPDEKASAQEVRAAYDKIISHLRMGQKTMMVDMMFNTVANWTETGMVNFLNMGEKQGLANFLKSNKELILEPELDEIIIEMGDTWVPDPKVRLGMKLFQIVSAFDCRQYGAPFSKNEEEKATQEKKEEENATGASSKRFPSKNPPKGGKPSS